MIPSKPQLLQFVPGSPEFQAALEERFIVHRLFAAADKESLFDQVCADVRAVFTIGSIGLSRAQIDRLPRLEIVSCLGVGYERVDVAACLERGIAVTHSPGANARSVAELAIGLLIDATRLVSKRDRAIRTLGGQSATFRERSNPVPSLYDKTLGILGWGAIGRAVAQRAQGLEMKVAYHSRRRDMNADAVWCESALSLATMADALIICVPGGAATFHMVNAAVIEALGPSGVLVNVSRGSVVDEAALTRALREGGLHGADLDVFEGEPDISDALLGLDNVVLSPHCAGLTHEAAAAMGSRTLGNLDAFLAGRALPDPVPEMTAFNGSRR